MPASETNDLPVAGSSDEHQPHVENVEETQQSHPSVHPSTSSEKGGKEKEQEIPIEILSGSIEFLSREAQYGSPVPPLHGSGNSEDVEENRSRDNVKRSRSEARAGKIPLRTRSGRSAYPPFPIEAKITRIPVSPENEIWSSNGERHVNFMIGEIKYTCSRETLTKESVYFKKRLDVF